MNVQGVSFASGASNRRDFLRASATAVGGLSLTSWLTGCGPKTPAPAPNSVTQGLAGYPEGTLLGSNIARAQIDDAAPAQAKARFPQADAPVMLSSELSRSMFALIRDRGRIEKEGGAPYKALKLNAPDGRVMAELLGREKEAREGQNMAQAGIKLTASGPSEYYPNAADYTAKAKEFFVNPNTGELYGVTYIETTNSNKGVKSKPTAEDAKQAEQFMSRTPR